MRTVRDQQGNPWSVDVMAGSYGACYLIFACEGAGEVRKAPVDAESHLESARQLESMSDDALQEALAYSTDLDEANELGF
ncbi:hypothetical protein GJ672_04040 [Spiribacter sp. 2438]|uniref:hypothetical protein n=1 Tax=Spiribacter sp. 2438 TaxID=2666185 RepID=UPI0012B033DA|nr:hypothetical protein [Spiribacter sp. 2438]QGM21521.1 hypothetical protein GJ672_04040 [Spiribacter sp. 2438]